MISSKILLTAGFDGLSKAKQVSPVSNWKANESCLFENHTLWGEGGGGGEINIKLRVFPAHDEGSGGGRGIG